MPGARRIFEARFEPILDYSRRVVYFSAVKGSGRHANLTLANPNDTADGADDVSVGGYS